MINHFLTLFTFFSFTISAQNLKLFEFSYSVYPGTEITESTTGDEASFQELRIAVNVPKIFNEGKTVLLNGLQYNSVYAKFKGPNSTAEDNLYFIAYSLTLVKQLANKWQFTGSFTPAISSDLEGSLSGDDFLFLGSATIGKTVSETFKWNAGLAYTSSFGEPLIIPLLELYSKKNDFMFHAYLPSKIEGLFIKEQIEYGLKIGLRGSQFNLATGTAQPVDDIKFSRINLGPTINYKVAEHFYLSLFIGISTGRKYDASSSTIGDFDFRSEDGFFFNGGIFIK